MMELGLILSRFVHYTATTTLAGVAFFPLYAYAGMEPESLSRWRSGVLFWSALLSLISGLGWFAFAVANMSGALTDILDSDVVATVFRETGFGAVWTTRMAVAGLLVGMTFLRWSRASGGHDLAPSLLAAVLLGSLAGTGHAQMEDGWAGALHVSADAAHLLAAGAWLGGLLALGRALLGGGGGRTEDAAPDVNGVLTRFSGMGYLSVAILMGTGLINSWFLVGSVPNLWSTTYGELLIAKLLMFAVMLVLAAVNRFWLVPSLSKVGYDGTGAVAPLRSLSRHALGEHLLGTTILFLVSVLGSLQPSVVP